MKLKINPKSKLFRWGPIDGLPIYPDYWYAGMADFKKNHEPGWPDIISFFNKEKFFVICDYNKLYNNGEKIFKKYILNNNELKNEIKKWDELINDFNKFKFKIVSINLKNLTNEELFILFKDWNSLYEKNFWNIGSLSEIANWGGEKMLSGELRKKIINKEDFNFAFERLSAPENLSFYWQEEIDLFKIKLIKDNAFKQERLIKHQQKYFWLFNSYYATKVLPVGYFKKKLDAISAKEAVKKIKEILSFKKQTENDKFRVIKKFKLSRKISKIGHKLAYCVWWQDLRKSYIFQANHIIDLFFKEFERRYIVNFRDLHYYTVNEVKKLAKNNIKIRGKEIKRRKDKFLLLWNAKGEPVYISGLKAEKIVKPFFENEIKNDKKELRGLVVSRGKVIGRVRIVHSPREDGKMKKGDILVAPMTSPDYIIALKKAAAVVTDEGGMTCHAAIVSRELKIPGIVGTKIATKILRDGDLVEVDANKGVVKILK